MKMLVLGCLITVTGCATATDLSSREPISVTQSARSLDEVVRCYSASMSNQRGFGLRTDQIPNGVRLSQTYEVVAVQSVMSTVEIIDLGNAREITVRGARSDGASILPPETERCA